MEQKKKQSTVVMNEKQRCLQLLDDTTTQYSAYQTKLREYQEQLKQQKDHTALAKLPTDRQRAFDDFQASQFVEYNNIPYNCLNNKCSLNCLNAASQEHLKCKCQALFMENRKHLHSPCDANSSLFGDALTREKCQSLGFLSNNNMEYDLFHRHLDSSDEVDVEKDKKDIVPPEEYQLERPHKPVLIFPTITCESCAPEFKHLQQDFTYENLMAVKDCIHSLVPNRHSTTSSKQTPKLNTARKRILQQPSPSIDRLTKDEEVSATAKNTTKNSYTLYITIFLLVILVLIGALFYKLHFHCKPCRLPNSTSLERDYSCNHTTGGAPPISINLTLPPQDLAYAYQPGKGYLSKPASMELDNNNNYYNNYL